VLGLQGGYNYQFAPNWLVGIEADIAIGDWSDSHAFSTTDGFTTLTLTRTSTPTLGTQGSFRGRFGFVDGPWLVYATGGGSFVQTKWSETWTPTSALVNPLPPSSVSASKTLWGWTVGGGVEYMLSPNALVRLEYLYANYGNFTVPLALTTNLGSIDVSTQIIRAGFSYRFTP
jgi:outer membrane immunogenic protein